MNTKVNICFLTLHFNKSVIIKYITMKKIILLIVLLIFVSSTSFAQTKYKVIRVNGTILIEKSGKELSNGLIFSENEELNFKTKHSKAAVINSQEGRMILTASNDGSRANYLPAMSNIASRGDIALNKSDLKNKFINNIVIFNKIILQINLNSFPLSQNAFFFIRYQYNSEEINKKITTNEDKIIIDKLELLKIDGKIIKDVKEVKSMKLYFMQNKKSVFISEFHPIFPDLNILKKEIQVIWDEYHYKKWDFKVDEINGYITEFYGKTNKKDLNDWLKIHFN